MTYGGDESVGRELEKCISPSTIIAVTKLRRPKIASRLSFLTYVGVGSAMWEIVDIFRQFFLVPDLLPLISDSRHLRPRNSWLFNGQLDVVLHNKRCNGSRPRTVKHSFIFHATETFWYCY